MFLTRQWWKMSHNNENVNLDKAMITDRSGAIVLSPPTFTSVAVVLSKMWLLLSFIAVFLIILLTRMLSHTRKIPVKDKTIFITGCDSGFGFSLALHCADLGMKVMKLFPLLHDTVSGDWRLLLGVIWTRERDELSWRLSATSVLLVLMWLMLLVLRLLLMLLMLCVGRMVCTVLSTMLLFWCLVRQCGRLINRWWWCFMIT